MKATIDAILEQRDLALKTEGADKAISPATFAAAAALQNHRMVHAFLMDLIEGQEKYIQSLARADWPTESQIAGAEGYRDGLKKAAKIVANTFPFMEG